MKTGGFFSGEPIVLEGAVAKNAKKEKGRLSLQLHPGLTVDVASADCETVEEATDAVTGRNYVRVTLKPDAEISATFQPRLARLAMTTDASSVPFTLGGTMPGAEPGSPVFASPAVGGGLGGLGGGGLNGQPTIGEFPTRCRNPFWGWVNDDKTYTDETRI